MITKKEEADSTFVRTSDIELLKAYLSSVESVGYDVYAINLDRISPIDDIYAYCNPSIKHVQLDCDPSIEDSYAEIKMSDLKPIPQTKEVEWENGEIVCKVDQIMPIGVFVGLDRTGRAVVELNSVMQHANNGDSFMTLGLHNIKKPETEAERIEREREENGEAMYMQHCKNLGSDKFYWNEKNPASKEAWCKLAEQYRKESE